MLYCNIYFLSFAAMRLVYQRLRGQCCSGAFLNKSHAVYDFIKKRNDETWGLISKSTAVYRLPLRCDRATARKGLELKGNTKQIR